MLAGMSNAEYVNWMAIYSTEPFPEERADLRSAKQMINIRRALGDKSGELKDFIPDYWGEVAPREQSREQIKSNVEILKAATKKKRKK